jgi:hypothetical protein
MPRFRPALAAVLPLAAIVLVTAAVLRDPEYDEGYTATVTSLAARPIWPDRPFRVGEARAAFAPAPTPWAIAGNLRRTDVHPPLYFWLAWAWRRCLGPSLIGTRLLSVAFSLGALALVAALATEAAIPVVPAVLLTLGCYGFVETGIVARGFAMAQCLTVAGVLLTLRATRAPRGERFALAAGLVLGAASFTNYLTAFQGAAALVWLLIHRRRIAVPMLAGMLPFLLADASFFAAQRSSRIGQFDPFAWDRMANALSHALGSATLGGLPLYVPAGATRNLASGLLALFLLALLALPILRWRHIGGEGARSLLAMAALAAPVGLLLLGLAAHSVPVEMRYLAFALPPVMLLIAGSLPSPWLAVIPLAVQTAAILGLMTQPATMQPEGAAARAAFAAVGDTGLVLLPRGNDGVGLVSAFLDAAPDRLHVLIVRPETSMITICDRLDDWPKVTAALLAVDRASIATRPMLEIALRCGNQIR